MEQLTKNQAVATSQEAVQNQNEPQLRDSGLTPSQLYVFMPPNLGGFFMVRSYYPSECHADYFDFERIEALKPAIEACGISTLSQSPMLGFHKQMDNRIKLLEEIL